MKLYELTDAYRVLQDRLLEAEGVLTPELEQELAQLDEDLDRKVENVALVVRELEAEAAGVAEEVERLERMKAARDHAAKRLKDYLKVQLTLAGRPKVAGKLVTVQVVKNGVPAITWLGTDEEIPEPFRRVRVELNGQAVRDEYRRTGQVPPGFEVSHGTHLRIR